MISFLDVKAAYDELRPEIDRAIARVCASGRYILGPEVERFEGAFASHVEAAHCVGVGNGLDALVLILRALGIGPGDEVIVPAQTFVATWLAVSWAGATPVPVEVDTDGALISPEAIEAAITPRTKAVMPVHLFGHPADLDPICDIASRHAIAVIEDAAQAHGARYQGKRIGARGAAAAWSFYPAKNLGAMGDGGAVTTDDAALAERIRLLRNYGSAGKHVHQIAGVNSRLDPIPAALMAATLPPRADETPAWPDRLVDGAGVPLFQVPPFRRCADLLSFLVRDEELAGVSRDLAPAKFDLTERRRAVR